ncbi:MAG: hypothetical protein FWB94_00175 [Chitinispirillia bacterium]|nr:hypothetical protein [Chitinispirillia bacterium]
MRDYRKIIAEMINNGKTVALYCHGIYCSHTLCYLDKFYGVRPAVVIDNDTRKKGFAEFGVPVMSFAEARERFDDLNYFICSNDFKYAIIGNLLENGVSPVKIINYCPVEKKDSCFYISNQINLFYTYGKGAFSSCNLDNCHSGFDQITDIQGNDDLGQKIDEYKNDYANGRVTECDNCELKFRQYVRTDGKFDVARAIQTGWSDCSFHCVFCSSKTKKLNTKCGCQESEFDRSDYEKYLRKFFSLNRLDENPILRIVLSERYFNDRLQAFCSIAQEFGVDTLIYDIFSGFSAYSEALANILAEGKGIIIWSLDAGTRETFKKIKQVDAFDKVVENANKYISKSVFGAKFICAKYLIVKGINDNKQEFDCFLHLVKGLGVENISLDWDFAVEPAVNDVRFIQECYNSMVTYGMRLQYKNINKVISESLNMNYLLKLEAKS